MEFRLDEFVRMSEQMWSEGRTELFDELFDRSFKSHTAPPGLDDFEAQKPMMEQFISAFSDMQFEHPHVISDGDTVVFHFQGHGRHTGEFMGIAATGKHVCMGGVSVARMRDGKIVESWDYFDMIGLMMQLNPEMASQFMGQSMGEGMERGREAA